MAHRLANNYRAYQSLTFLCFQIADFGVSDMFEGDNDLLSKHAGSPAFQAPEVLNHGKNPLTVCV